MTTISTSISKLSSAIFFLRNLLAFRKKEDISSQEIGGIIYRGYKPGDATAVAQIYKNLNDLSFDWKWENLFGKIGGKCFFVASHIGTGGKEEILGINMYYFNARDFAEQTIHEGFIGVIPAATGRGIASTMRSLAIKHFKKYGLKGISTRISINNFPSLKSAQKIGFVPYEEYNDAHTGERRYYLIANLNNSHE